MPRANLASLEKYLPGDEHRAEFRELLAYAEKLPDTDEILKVIRAMGLFSSIAQTIPTEIASVLNAHSQKMGELKEAIEKAHAIPDAIALAAKEVSVKTDRIADAADEIKAVTGKVFFTFIAGSLLFGGFVGSIITKHLIG